MSRRTATASTPPVLVPQIRSKSSWIRRPWYTSLKHSLTTLLFTWLKHVPKHTCVPHVYTPIYAHDAAQVYAKVYMGLCACVNKCIHMSVDECMRMRTGTHTGRCIWLCTHMHSKRQHTHDAWVLNVPRIQQIIPLSNYSCRSNGVCVSWYIPLEW